MGHRFTALLALLMAAACGERAPHADQPVAVQQPPAAMPALPDGVTIAGDTTRPIDGGLTLRKLEVVRQGVPMAVWITRRPGAAGPQPVVVIAPAGTPLIWGMALAAEGTEDGDADERLPWATRGYVVVTYSLDGAVASDDPSEDEALAAVRAFVAAHTGLDNARAALDVAFAREPGLDRARVFAVGHSSAATLALRFGAEEPRVTAIVAFNPVTDVETRLGDAFAELERVVPGAGDALRASSPIFYIWPLRTKPIFLFHSVADRNVPVSESDNLAEEIDRPYPGSVYARVATGDHYDSMIEQGLPRAISWADAVALTPAPATEREWRVRDDERPRGLEEPNRYLHRINVAADDYYSEHGTYPPGSAELTPAQPCCDLAGKRCPAGDPVWSAPPWSTLSFSVGEVHDFRYSYQGHGKTFAATAVGDPDCDGTSAEYRLEGNATSGNPTSMIISPARRR